MRARSFSFVVNNWSSRKSGVSEGKFISAVRRTFFEYSFPDLRPPRAFWCDCPPEYWMVKFKDDSFAVIVRHERLMAWGFKNYEQAITWVSDNIWAKWDRWHNRHKWYPRTYWGGSER